MINDDIWNNAVQQLRRKFQTCNKLEICNNIIRDFEATNPKKKYKSDLEVFIRESKLEDFFNENGETVFVLTIHKAKGKEFDNVFIMLENFHPVTEDAKRQLYVAMTRAKKNLTIHLNGNYLDNISVEHLKRMEDREVSLPPGEMAIHLTHKDVDLDFFIGRQYYISTLNSGDSLAIDGIELLNNGGKAVARFSKPFVEKIEALKKRGYYPERSKVNYIVFWRKEGSRQETKIILPELYFKKQ